MVGCLSTEDNFELRQAIRQTWARTQLAEVLVWFVLARPSSDRVIEEAALFNDIVFVDIEEGYAFALPPKVQTFFGVSTQAFPETPWFIKTDDDSFLRIAGLLKVLDTQSSREDRIYLGLMFERNWPGRDRDSKWFVAKDLWPNKAYPKYMDG